MLRKVYLEGEIGEKFGKEFEISATSFGSVIQCLEMNFPEFRPYLVDCAEKGINFTCQVADKPIQDERELLLQYEDEGAMIITAVPAGSKSGIGKILAAVVLITLAYFTYGATTGLFGAPIGTTGLTIGQVVGATMFSMGISLGMAGIQQLMAPDPSTDNQQDESYLFQGAGQTIVEGDPVPVLYGKLRVPGRPISFEIKNANQTFIDFAEAGVDSIAPNDAASPGHGGGGNPNDTATEVLN